MLCVEGELTGDGRMIERNSLRWENLPLPLRYVAEDVGAHDGAQVVGQITEVTRASNGQILGRGTMDMGSEIGREVIRKVGEKLITGVSVDLDDVSFEVRIAAELLDGMDLMEDDPEEPGPETDSEGRVVVAKIKSDDEVRVTTSGRVRAATIVAIPAFATAQIELDPEEEDEEPDSPAAPDEDEDEDEEMASLVASTRIPVDPPVAWFADPGLTGPTPLVVTEDGRVYGHLAEWGTCHVGLAHKGCVTPPHSATGYAYFRTGSVLTAEGREVSTGRITLETRHAVDRMTAAQALAHYENTGRVVADVAAGEDAFGIWVAGALRPGTTPSQVRSLRAAPLSGDWRRVAGNLELVAALAVNVPGFPIPRPAGLVASGVVQSLVASGMLAPRKVQRPGTPGALSIEDLRYLKRLADRERAEEARATLSAAESLALRVRSTTLAMKRSQWGPVRRGLVRPVTIKEG